MPFSVGDPIVHPGYGTGTVVGVTREGAERSERDVFVIRFADKQLTLQIPRRRAADLGVRPVMGRNQCDEVFALLRQRPTALPADHKQRRVLVESWVQSGKPLSLAQTLRELYWHDSAKRLNQVDRRLMELARERLVAEMAVALDSPPDALRTQITQALQDGRQMMAA
jgi:CarD family transcriptional regulator